jgi:hypothetical protein
MTLQKIASDGAEEDRDMEAGSAVTRGDEGRHSNPDLRGDFSQTPVCIAKKFGPFWRASALPQSAI